MNIPDHLRPPLLEQLEDQEGSDDCLIFRLKTALNKEVQALISTTIKVKEYQNGTNRIK